eukprot:scaffold116894_cov80-Cyclotella_meneghiniana.AAC.1
MLRASLFYPTQVDIIQCTDFCKEIAVVIATRLLQDLRDESKVTHHYMESMNGKYSAAVISLRMSIRLEWVSRPATTPRNLCMQCLRKTCKYLELSEGQFCSGRSRVQQRQLGKRLCSFGQEEKTV